MEASVWRFVAREGHEEEFEALYGPRGEWAKFFRHTPDYSGTFLLKDHRRPRGYVLIDVWESRTARDQYCSANKDLYDLLDEAGEEVTESETHEGWFGDVAEVLARI